MERERTERLSAPDLGGEIDLALLRATESVALVCARQTGKGDQERAKEVAAAAMLQVLEESGLNARVVLTPHGEGVLSFGSRVGGEQRSCDLGVFPIEGAGLVARGLPNALSVAVAVAPEGFASMPAVAYVEKIVVGPAARGAVDLDDAVADNLRRIAFSRDVRVSDLNVAILDRPRHQELIDQVRATGARILSLQDGDIAGALMAACDGTGVDAMLGIGGLQEAVIAAAAVRCLGGDLQCRLWPRNDEERILAGAEAGRKFSAQDLVPGEATVATTGVTGGVLLPPVWFGSGWSETTSLLMSSRRAAVRRISTRHHRMGAPA